MSDCIDCNEGLILASGDVCCPLITFANSLDPDLQNVAPGLDQTV